MTNPVKIPGKVCGKKDLWGTSKRMALGGITVAFLGDPQKPHRKIFRFPIPTCFSFFCSTCDLFAAAKQLRKKDHRFADCWNVTYGLKGKLVVKNLCKPNRKPSKMRYNTICELSWCSAELPDILWWWFHSCLKHHVFRFNIFNYFCRPKGARKSDDGSLDVWS